MAPLAERMLCLRMSSRQPPGVYGWITHAQAVDGLALAETTSGPLIMVLQFVGFMAAWNNPEGMSLITR